jgi:predicted acylesterase/phospholipase RssA
VNSRVNRALIFQGGASLGAYEAGAYKAIKEDLSQYSEAKGMGNDPMFHIVSGTSIGAIDAAILVSYVKENKTWKRSDERLVEFWEYLSTQSYLTLPMIVTMCSNFRYYNQSLVRRYHFFRGILLPTKYTLKRQNTYSLRYA